MSGSEDASAAPHVDGTADAAGDGPGYGTFDEPDEAELRALDAGVESGARPEFNRVRLL